jgi:predicted nucleic acid-binding protein
MGSLDQSIGSDQNVGRNGRRTASEVMAAWARDEFSVVASVLQLSEIAEVLTRPRLTRRFQYSHRDAESFVRLIVARTNVVQISGELKFCRAPDDDEILKQPSLQITISGDS